MISGEQIIAALGLVFFAALHCTPSATACQWHSVNTDSGVAFNQFQFFNANDGWVLTAGSVLQHTRDGGKSWTRQEFPGYILRRFRFLDAQRGWWVGEKSLQGDPDFRGAIFATVDGGVHWSEQATGIKSKSHWRLADVWPRHTGGKVWALGDEYLMHTLAGFMACSIFNGRAISSLPRVVMVLYFATYFIK